MSIATAPDIVPMGIRTLRNRCANDFLNDVRRIMHFRAAILLAVAFAPTGFVVAAQNLNESQAIQEIERLGGKIKRDETLPGRTVTAVDFFAGCQRVGDKDLYPLKALKNLTTLNLGCTKITDAGLKEIRELKNLTTLNLSSLFGLGPQITDAGLKEIKGLKNLTGLGLGFSKITDAGLEEIGKFENLRQLEPQLYPDHGRRFEEAQGTQKPHVTQPSGYPDHGLRDEGGRGIQEPDESFPS